MNSYFLCCAVQSVLLVCFFDKLHLYVVRTVKADNKSSGRELFKRKLRYTLCLKSKFTLFIFALTFSTVNQFK